MSTRTLKARLSRATHEPMEFEPVRLITVSGKDKLKAAEAMQARIEKMKEKDRPSMPSGSDLPQQNLEWRVIEGRYKSLNVNSAPLEHLVASRKMGTRDDPESLEILRLSVARRLVDAFEGAYVSALRSPDLEPSVSSSSGGRPISDYRLDCAMTIDRVRAAVPKTDFKIIEGFCCRDQYIWRGLPRKQERAKILLVHRALDRAGAAIGMIRADVVKDRWSRPKSSPKPKAKA